MPIASITSHTSLPHPSTLVLHPDFAALEPFMRSLPQRMANGEGTVIHKGRNELRIMEFEGRKLVVKAFRRPHLINQFVYGIFRASTAVISSRCNQTAPTATKRSLNSISAMRPTCCGPSDG